MDALVTDLAVPEGVGLEGLWAVARDGAGFRRGHRIEGVETRPEGSRRWCWPDDPGYELSASGGRLVFFPGREWTGASTVEVATLSALGRPPVPDQRMKQGGASASASGWMMRRASPPSPSSCH